MADLRVVNYDTLKAAIANLLNREDLTDDIPVFIQDAEAMFNRELVWRKLTVRDSDPAPTNPQPLPVDFLEPISIEFTTSPLTIPLPLTPVQMQEWIAANPGLQGTPQYYTITGDDLLFDRTPEAGTTLEMVSRIRIESLDDITTTNDLLLEHPDIYKYGALMMAEVHLKNDPRLATWTALYQNARDSLKRLDRRATLGTSPPRVRSRRRF